MHSSEVEVNTFLQKYSSELSSKLNTLNIKAEILTDTEEGLKVASQKIQNGSLVAFPTETVYGLGADALNEDAVRSIFETKGISSFDCFIKVKRTPTNRSYNCACILY